MSAAAYRPAHGGYPGQVPPRKWSLAALDARREARRIYTGWSGGIPAPRFGHFGCDGQYRPAPGEFSNSNRYRK